MSSLNHLGLICSHLESPRILDQFFLTQFSFILTQSDWKLTAEWAVGALSLFRKSNYVKRGSPVLEFTCAVKFWCLQERSAMTRRICTLFIAATSDDQKWRRAAGRDDGHGGWSDASEPVSCQSLLYSLIMLPSCCNCVSCSATQQCRFKSVDGTHINEKHTSTQQQKETSQMRKKKTYYCQAEFSVKSCSCQLSRTMETDLEAIEQKNLHLNYWQKNEKVLKSSKKKRYVSFNQYWKTFCNWFFSQGVTWPGNYWKKKYLIFMRNN